MKISNKAIFGTLAIVNGIQLIVLTIRNMKLSKEHKKDYVKGKIDGDMFGEYVHKRSLVD